MPQAAPDRAYEAPTCSTCSSYRGSNAANAGRRQIEGGAWKNQRKSNGGFGQGTGGRQPTRRQRQATVCSAKKFSNPDTPLASRGPYDTQISSSLPRARFGPSPGAHARNAEPKLLFPSWIVTGKPSMKRRRSGDSDFDGDLIDPSVGAPEPPPPGSPHANAHTPVFVGGGEREARAYVAPTAVPSAAAPKSTADKVAISSAVDPRRMQTMRLPPGRPRPPLSPDEQQRPDLMSEEGTGTPSSRYPTSAAQISQRPKSAMASATVVRAPPSVPTNTNGPPAVIWIFAVALAALIGAGTALWLRRSSAPPAPPAPTVAPAPVPVPAPVKPAPATNR